MNRDQRAQLEAEARDLQQKLQTMARGRVLERGSVEHRLAEVQARLAAAPPAGREPASARLTFSGAPVIDSFGVHADFGTEATRAFSEAVAAVAAAEVGPLAMAGPIPNRDQNQLIITGTALGSFGFELQEVLPPQSTLTEETPVGRALVQVREVLESCLGTDDELAETVAATNPRAIRKVRDFLTKLAENEAICGLDVGGRKFRFQDVEQLRGVVTRLGDNNLLRREEDVEASLTGVLPHVRRFEFQMHPSQEIFTGRIAPEAGTVEDLGRLYQHLHQSTTLRMLTTRVGVGRPRYTLLRLPTWA